MPNPIDRNRPSPAGHEDFASAQSIPEDPSTLKSMPPRSDAAGGVCGPDQPGASRAAVDSLVKKAGTPQRQDCTWDVFEAATTCGAAALGAVLGTATGPGDLALVAIGGAACGGKLLKAKECLDQ